MTCKDCEQTAKKCICSFVTKFFAENGELMENLAESEAREKPGAKRCLACHFYNCRCSRGLRKRLEKL